MLIQNQNSSDVNQHPFILFLDLVTLDQKIRTVHDEIQSLQEGIANFIQQKQAMTERFDRFKRQVLDVKKEIDTLNLDMQSLEEKEKTKRAQFEQSRSMKEYQPLKKEIEQLKRSQHATEQALLGFWNKLETAEKEFEAQKCTYTEKVQECHDAIGKNQDRIEQLQKDLELLHSDRPAKEAGVPNEWLEKYMHMRMNVADPVVPVVQNSCNACFYSVAGQELMRLRRRAVIQCKGCFRLLYLAEAMHEEHPAAPNANG